MPGPHRRRRTAVALAAGVVLASGGGSAIGWAATHQVSAPQPSAAAAGHVPGPPSGPPHGAGPSAGPVASRPTVTGPVLPAADPVSITVPAIGVHAPLQRLGENPDGSLAVPRAPHYDEPAWYTGSPTPGQPGPAVIEGHVDSAANGPSVFFRLGALTPGDRVQVARADHTTAVFTVDAVRRYPKDAFPTTTVYADTDRAELRLITCGGDFDHATGHYESNIVVFAHLTASHPS